MRSKHPAKGKAEPEESFNGFVDSQLAWDRAMAEALAKAMTRNERPLVVGIMGSGHIRFGHGVPHQLRDLGVSNIATLLPVELKGECESLRPGLADAVFTLPEKPQPVQEPPRLGIVLEDAPSGLRISTVTPGSLAEKTGLKSGDRLVELAGRPATSSAEAVSAIRRQPPGTWMPLRINRGDSDLDLIVKFPAQP
jgi:membrane-associated protease RseP (regulator of RpoE activity)